jgi:hypothetical protein
MIKKLRESEVAKELGISREEIKKLRTTHLFIGEDFSSEGREIILTEKGVERMRELISRLVNQAAEVEVSDEVKTPAMVLPDLLQKIADKVEAEIVELTVVKTWQNPRILDAQTHDGRRVRVRVRTNKNFMSGMKLRAKADDDTGSVYVHEGRCPRYRGVW